MERRGVFGFGLGVWGAVKEGRLRGGGRGLRGGGAVGDVSRHGGEDGVSWEVEIEIEMVYIGRRPGAGVKLYGMYLGILEMFVVI